MKPWFHAMAGRGPDWSLRLGVRPEDREPLRALVARHATPAFELVESTDERLRYVDAHHRDAYVAATSNLWVFHALTVEGDELHVLRGYGGCDTEGEVTAAEGRLVEALLASDGLVVGDWSIAAGGDGYPVEPVAAGRGAADLRAYVTA